MKNAGYVRDCEHEKEQLNCKTFTKNGRPKIISRGRLTSESFFYEELMGKVLKKIALRAEKFFGNPMKKLILIVPSSFNEAQRITYINSAKFSGLEISLLDATTALAIAYGVERENKAIDENVLVVLSKNGTHSLSIVKISKTSKYSVEAYSIGDAYLNGTALLNITEQLENLLTKVKMTQDEIANYIVAGLKTNQIKRSNQTVSFHYIDDPVEAAAVGGAHKSLKNDGQRLEILEIVNVSQPHSKTFQKLIPKSSLIRCNEKQMCETSFDYDDVMRIPTADNGDSTPIKIRGKVNIHIKFYYDDNKILHITSFNMSTSDETKCSIDDDKDSSWDQADLDVLIRNTSERHHDERRVQSLNASGELGRQIIKRFLSKQRRY